MQGASSRSASAGTGTRRCSTPPSEPCYAAPTVGQALDIIELLSRNSRAYGIAELVRTLDTSTNTGVLQKDTRSPFGEWELAVIRCADRIAAGTGYAGDAYGKFEEAIKVRKPPTDIDPRRTQGVRP